MAVSDAYLRATMTQREQVMGRHLFEVFPDNPADPSADGVSNLRASLERVIRSLQPDSMAVQKYDIRRPAQEGGGYEERYWSPVNSPVLRSNAELAYIIHRVEDVTEFVRSQQRERQRIETTDALRRRTEQMEVEVYLSSQRLAETNARLRGAQQELETSNRILQVRNEEVERANRVKSEFLASVSHELRTPLNAIIGFSDLLAEQATGALSARQLRFLGHIQLGAHHLLELINDILDLLKVEAGHLELHRENIDVTGVLSEVVAGIRPAAAAKQIQIQSSLAPGLLAHADRIRFKQILLNLLSNAIKFTPEEGRIWIDAVARRGRLTISVADTGIGIALEEQESIFAAFHQAGTTTKGIKEGTGLGLAITKRLVEEHGGHIWVESEPAKGTRFTFTLQAGRAGGDSRPAGDRDRPLILVFDAEAAARDLAAFLEPAGYRVVTAASTPEALAIARDLAPDAVTINMFGQGKQAWDAVSGLKAAPATAAIPVVGVSVMEGRLALL